MKYAHGTNTAYTNGRCRCEECRRAHTECLRRYRAGERAWIPAKEVRRHLRSLSRVGVGLRSVHYATDLNLRSLFKLRKGGSKQKVTRETAALILAVDASVGPDNMRTSPKRARQAIREMSRYGLTYADIAERAGAGRHNRTWIGAVLRRERIWVRTEVRMLRALAEVRKEMTLEKEIGEVCNECGLLHSMSSRVQRLQRLDATATFIDAHEAWPCIYPNTAAGQRNYYRDMDVLNGRGRRAA